MNEYSEGKEWVIKNKKILSLTLSIDIHEAIWQQ